MTLVDVYLAFGESDFQQLLKSVSISRLKTYQIFDQIKTRLRLVKLNSEHLRKAAPRLWGRLKENDEDLAGDLAQAILVSHLDLIIAALDMLGIPHQDGFFGKDMDTSAYLTEDWQQRAYDGLKEKFNPLLVKFYLNHLGVETSKADQPFLPA